MKHILKLSDLSREDVTQIVNRAFELKQDIKSGKKFSHLQGKTLGLLFNKPSTRTRLSFESAMVQLGGTPTFISAADTQISRNEPIRDTARVLSRFLDAVAVRTYSQSELEELAHFSDIPVINALTDDFHPCQILSDFMTVVTYKSRPRDLKIAWVGDGNNVAQSWINLTGVMGLNLHMACPEGYGPDPELVAVANARGGRVKVTTDPYEAVAGADAINTDVWASMGQEAELEERIQIFQPYQVNDKLVAAAKSDALVLHCLPAHRGEEITHEVLEGKQSVVWEQAENKMHLHRAVLDILITENEERRSKEYVATRKDGGRCDQWCDG